MSKRPLSVTIIGWVFVCVGCVSLVGGMIKFIGPGADASAPRSNHQDLTDLAYVAVSAIMAITGGAFVLRRHNWARWLCVAWMGAHVVLSVLHTPVELIVHGVLFAVVLWILFRAPASEYFRGATTPP
jgi:hypothetical protein